MFYSFLYLSRELFRILSVTDTYDIWFLSEKEVSFYNLFFAFISVIIAQSIFFTLIFERPRKFYEKKRYLRISIVNDQRVLTWSFLSWFSKLAALFGLWFGFSIHGGFYVLSLYPDYKYLFVLLIVVLFFQTWNTIRLMFKKFSLRWLITSIIIVSISSFGLSKINLIDYKSINDIFTNKNLFLKYNLEPPESSYHVPLEKRSLVENIYFVRDFNFQNICEPIIIIDNKKVAFDELFQEIKLMQLANNEVDVLFMVYQLHIDRRIEMKHINKLKQELSKAGVLKIAFAVIPYKPEYDIRFYQNHSVPLRLVDYNSEYFKPLDIENELKKYSNIINIEISKKGEIYVNDTLIIEKNLKHKIKTLIKNNSNYLIKYSYNDEVIFSNYLSTYSYTKSAVYELRNEFSLEKYNQEYDSIIYEQQREVDEIFSFRIFELTNEIKTRVKQ